MDHVVIGNSAFFSRSEKATFADILKLDSMSQVSAPKESKTVLPGVSNRVVNQIPMFASTSMKR